MDDEKMPKKALDSMEAQISALKKAAAKRNILVVLDGVLSGLFLINLLFFIVL